MSPTCSKAAMRVLITALLATTAANAAALPHEVLDARAPAPVQNAQLAAEAIQAAASAAAENPSNFFEDISDELNNRTAWEVFRDFFTRLFGPREDDDDNDTPAVVTVTVTPTPEAVSSAAAAVTSAIEALSSAIEATSSVTLVSPPGPSEVVSEIVSTTSTPLSELIMSILPIGDLTTSINATTLPAIFSTAPEETPVATPSVIDITAPFPTLNATSGQGVLPTAVSITGEFSVSIPLVTDVPTPANSTLPEGTGISLPYGSDLPVNTSLPLNATATIDSTTLVIVTETVTPVPIGTAPVVVPIGTDPASVSVGTGLPIVIVPSALWPNSTYGEPTVLPVPAGTGLPIGTGLPLSTGISIPLGTGSAVLPAVPLSTGIPLLTGTGSTPEGTALPIASPLYPNTTSSVPDALTLVVPVPISVTGIPDPVIVNVTIPAANATAPVAPEDPSVSVTAVPITVTGVPGAVFNVSVTIPVAAPFANATAVETAALPIQTSPVPAVSVGTGLPVASLSADVSAPFANTTIVAVPTDAPVVIVGPEVPAVETPVVEPGQLSVSVSLTGDYSG